MKVIYDPKVDALYIRLLEGKYECRTVRLSDVVALNLGPEEQLVGIEVLDAKNLLGNGSLPSISIENLSLTA